ncbi:MAG TPA: aminopeptidase P family protein [Acidimicrobiales bacterium]|nr:aminopeptidase P family protein [Acidimicrobiales bacterium]
MTAGPEAAPRTARPAPMRAMDVASRLPRLRNRLAGAGCDALLVTSLANIRYLIGFTGSAALLMVTAAGSTLTTDGRYRTQATEQLGAAGVGAAIEIGPPADQHAALATLAGRLGGRPKVGLEAGSITWAAKRNLETVMVGAELVATAGLVENLRRVKDAGEQDRIEAAAAIADAALAKVVGMVGDGRSESELALALDTAMRRLGAHSSAFETIVAAGPNGAKPHARPTSRPIRPGEMVVIDFGATVDGYRSDMTRTVCCGQPTGSKARRMYEVVLASQAAGVAAVRPGRKAAEVDRACRSVIAEAGWADAFVHGTGHGVGIDIHEAPAVSATSADTLEEASVVTVEPGVYLPGEGGVRIEDTVVVTAEGCRTVTRYPKDLILA